MYSKYVKMHFKTAMQYKLNTFLLTLSALVVSLGEILAVYMIFYTFHRVGYWGFYESALTYGIIMTVYSFIECFARGYDEFSSLIRDGDLDRILVRPVNVYFQIFCNKIAYQKIIKIIFGLIVSAIALANLGIVWTISKVVVMIFTFVCGITVIMGIEFISAGISIFTVEQLEFINIITNGSKELCYYPINIYHKFMTKFFTFIIPLACFNYLPISYIMGYGNLPSIVYALSPFLGMLFIIPCFLFFKWKSFCTRNTSSRNNRCKIFSFW